MSLESWPYTGDGPHLCVVSVISSLDDAHIALPHILGETKTDQLSNRTFQSGGLDSKYLPLGLERSIDLDPFSLSGNHWLPSHLPSLDRN